MRGSSGSKSQKLNMWSMPEHNQTKIGYEFFQLKNCGKSSTSVNK